MSLIQTTPPAFGTASTCDAQRPMIDDTAIYTDQEAEIEAARATMVYMTQLQRMHTSWMATYDDADVHNASLPELLALLKTAPTEFARGLVFGKLSLRGQERALEHARVAP